MRLLELFLSFISFNVLSCSEVLSPKIPPNQLEIIGPDLIYKVSTYLDDNPFLTLAPLNRYFLNLFTEVYKIKYIFHDRFHIPEFFTDDIDDNEKELKYLFLKYYNFANNPKYIIRAFLSELLYGNKIDRLMFPLINFLKNREELSRFDIEYVLGRRKMTKYCFQVKAKIPDSCIHEIQMSIVSNPENMELFRSYLKLHTPNEIEEFHILDEWIHAALASNLPDMLFIEFHDSLKYVLESSYLWTLVYVPVNFYPDLFDRIKVFIDELFTNDPFRNYLLLLNSIRFGPIDPDLYNDRIKSARFPSKAINLMSHCASLSNKKDLFYNLIHDPRCTLLTEKNILVPCDAPIEMYKLLFDIYELDQEKGVIWVKDSKFERVLFQKCLVSSIEFNQKRVTIELLTLSNSNESSIPPRFTFKRSFDSETLFFKFISEISKLAKFSDSNAFESFLPRFLNENLLSTTLISGDNMKLILQSESIQQLIRQMSPEYSVCRYPVFQIKMEEVLKVIDEPVCYLGDIIALANDNLYGSLTRFRTNEQLERFESLFDIKIESINIQNFDFFIHRHIFKYLIDKERSLPANLSKQTRELLKIDYPFLQI